MASKARPPLARLGLNPLGLFFLFISATALILDVVVFKSRGLSIEWPRNTLVPILVLFLALVGLWLNFFLFPGKDEREWLAAELVYLSISLALLTNTLALLQYGLVALGLPFADPWLAHADSMLGVNVSTLAAWAHSHTLVDRLIFLSYMSFLPQLLFALIVLTAYRDRAQLWEFVFHFHVCAVICVAALAIWPALCPPDYYGFAPTVDMTRLIGQIDGFHRGALKVVHFDQLEGLVSFPSLHVAGAMAVTWAFRRRWLVGPLGLLNIALTLSTVVSGVHYAIDVVGAAGLFLCSVAAYRWWGVSLLQAVSDPPVEPSPAPTESEVTH